MRNRTEAAKTAQAIRKELKAKYPELKIRVTSETYSGGSSVRVKYLIEDLEQNIKFDEIKSLVDKYQYGHFDGMVDLYEYSNSRDDIPQVKYSFVEREVTYRIYKKALDAYNKYWQSSLGAYESDSWSFKGVKIGGLDCRTKHDFDDSRRLNDFLEEKFNI